MHRILANLGPMDELTFENMKGALEASKKQQRIAVVKLRAGKDAAPKVQANLRFLDLAVAWELWRQTGIGEAVKGALPASDSKVGDALVVASLAFQRLVQPDSKLAAVRWFPETALPELLGIGEKQFNNTRIHRVLDNLEAATPALMAKLPSLFLGSEGTPVSMYLDVTDASFVGRGPEKAEVGKNKEEQIRRKVGIVLLCDERGYPLRWQVIRGNRTDGDAMLDMLKEVGQLSWTGSTPIVMDRAMGRSAYISIMLKQGIHFLTAMVRTEFATYAPRLPWREMQDLELGVSPDAVPELVKQATQRAEKAGLVRVNDTMFIMDCGVVSPAGEGLPEFLGEEGDSQDPVIRALQVSMRIRQLVADGRYLSQAAAARSLGMSRALATKYMRLLTLSEEIRAAILAGEVEGWPLATFLHLARTRDKDKQLAEFIELRQSDSMSRVCSTISSPPATVPQSVESPASVRVVAFFNPQHLADDRCKAKRRQESVTRFVQQLNKKLEQSRNGLSPQKILSMVESRLRRDDQVTKFDVSVSNEQEADGRKRHCVHVEPNPEAWQTARRYDGFSVLVAPPDMSSPAEHLAKLYRAKDMVEKDFRTIKSVTELAPVRHRTDPKVAAHVTLCMLALALERTITERLQGMCTAEHAIGALQYCCLNAYKSTNGPSLYTVTELSKERATLLRKLQMSYLADDDYMAQVIKPR